MRVETIGSNVNYRPSAAGLEQGLLSNGHRIEYWRNFRKRAWPGDDRQPAVNELNKS